MDTQKTPLGVLGDSSASKHQDQKIAASQAKASSNRGNKENPAQSPLRQKGSSKKPASAFGAENASSGAFGAAALGQSGAKRPSAFGKQSKGKPSTGAISEQPLAKAKQLFGDSTSSYENLQAPISTNDTYAPSKPAAAVEAVVVQEVPSVTVEVPVDSQPEQEETTGEQKVEVSSSDRLLPDPLRQLKEAYESGHDEVSAEVDAADEETKESVARFESLRQELSSSEFKNCLLGQTEQIKEDD